LINFIYIYKNVHIVLIYNILHNHSYLLRSKVVAWNDCSDLNTSAYTTYIERIVFCGLFYYFTVLEMNFWWIEENEYYKCCEELANDPATKVRCAKQEQYALKNMVMYHIKKRIKNNQWCTKTKEEIRKELIERDFTISNIQNVLSDMQKRDEN